MRTRVLEDAAIVCSTLSFSGSGAFTHMDRPFDVVIIDEAAQAVEPSILIPLTAGCKQVKLNIYIRSHGVNTLSCCANVVVVAAALSAKDRICFSWSC